MDELSERRKRLFSGAKFSSALFYNGDSTRGASASFRYFSGCNVDGTYFALKRDGGVLLANEMNYRMAKSLSRYPVKLLGKEPAKALRQATGRGKVSVCGVEMHATRFLALQKKAKLKLVEESEEINAVRGSKSESERKLLADSARIARKILGGLEPWEHKTEQGLASAIKIAALEAGAEVSFEPIVATGRNSAFPHHHATRKKLGDAVLVDFGVKKNGYCSDFTRCYFRKVGTKEVAAYEKCVDIFDELLDGLGSCGKGREVAALSERLFKKYGLPRPIHSIGHGIGLDVHEYPHLGGKSDDSLEDAVLALEPAAYFKSFGVRFEEMVANTKKGWRKI